MDCSIDPVERSQLDPHFDDLVDYINRSIETPPTLGFLMEIHLKSTDLVLNVYRNDEPVAKHTVFSDS